MGAFKRRQTARHDLATRHTWRPDEGLHVFCWCHRCGHNAELDTSTLIARLARYFRFRNLAGACAAPPARRDVATRPSWPNHGGGQITRYG